MGIFQTVSSASSVLLLQMICLAPYLVWVIIGAQEINCPCNNYDRTPDLAVWLVVEGSVGIFSSLSGIAAGMFRKTVLISYFFLLLNLFFLSWSILGAVRLSQDVLCEWLNPRLYSTAFAAVIVGFIGFSLAVLQSSKQND